MNFSTIYFFEFWILIKFLENLDVVQQKNKMFKSNIFFNT
jgi:hypothetical protein